MSSYAWWGLFGVSGFCLLSGQDCVDDTLVYQKRDDTGLACYGKGQEEEKVVNQASVFYLVRIMWMIHWCIKKR